MRAFKLSDMDRRPIVITLTENGQVMLTRTVASRLAGGRLGAAWIASQPKENK